MLLHSLTKVSLSTEKLCICSQKICILSQKYCVSWETWTLKQFSSHLVLLPSQKFPRGKLYFCKRTQNHWIIVPPFFFTITMEFKGIRWKGSQKYLNIYSPLIIWIVSSVYILVGVSFPALGWNLDHSDFWETTRLQALEPKKYKCSAYIPKTSENSSAWLNW